jgi:hypothetical protein
VQWLEAAKVLAGAKSGADKCVLARKNNFKTLFNGFNCNKTLLHEGFFHFC